MLQGLFASEANNTEEPFADNPLPETDLFSDNTTDASSETQAPFFDNEDIEEPATDLVDNVDASNTTVNSEEAPANSTHATNTPLTGGTSGVEEEENSTDSNLTDPATQPASDIAPPPPAGSNSTQAVDAACQKISVSYEIVLEEGEDPDTVLEQIIAATTAGIDDGTLQESILNVDPDSPVQVEASTEPPPAPTEPPVATDTPAELGNTTAAPSDSNGSSDKEEKGGDESSSMLPIITGCVVAFYFIPAQIAYINRTTEE